MKAEDIPVAQIPIEVPTESTAEQHVPSVSPAWQRVALGVILLISTFLNLFRLGQTGYGNSYYAAAVKSMLTSWHNFFFVSFDPGGFVSIDKPPLGFWIQTVSARLLGFSGLSILLPEALAGVLSVALLYQLVRRVFGPIAGLLAALALALMPISVVTARNNTIDSLLVLMVLLAAWTVSRAAETGRLGWLLLTAALVGLGFNIKMAEVYLVVPAFVLLYLLGAPVRWRTRIGHLALATVVLLVTSLSWAMAVDMTSASQRPYVDSSSTNSELALAFGYNGLDRLIGWSGDGNPPAGRPVASNRAPAQGPTPEQLGFSGVSETGAPGPLRLFNDQLGGQVSWLLPLAILGLMAAAWQTRPRFPLNRRQQALVLWGVWLLTMGIFFSLAQFFHPYYMVMLAPAICALFGIGIVTMWNDYHRPERRGSLLPLALAGTAAVQAYLLLPYPNWSRWLTPVMSGLCFLAALVLIGARLISRIASNDEQVSLEDIDGASATHSIPWPNQHVLLSAAVTGGVLALLIIPLIWGAIPVMQGNSALFPVAGPDQQNTAFARFARGFDSQSSSARLVQYLQAHQGHVRFLVATLNANTAAPIILATDQPVMTLGGFSGADKILPTQQLINLVNNGMVRFFLLPSSLLSGFGILNDQDLRGFGEFDGNQNANLALWVSTHCRPIPRNQWQSGPSGSGGVPGAGFRRGFGERLFDCANHQ